MKMKSLKVKTFIIKTKKQTFFKQIDLICFRNKTHVNSCDHLLLRNVVIQFDHMRVGQSLDIFLFLPHPSLPWSLSALRPSEYWQWDARRTAWTWKCLGSITHDDAFSANASFRRAGQFRVRSDWLSTFHLESNRFAASSRHFLIFSRRRMRLGSSVPRSSLSSSSGSGWLLLLCSGHGDYRGMETM